MDRLTMKRNALVAGTKVELEDTRIAGMPKVEYLKKK